MDQNRIDPPGSETREEPRGTTRGAIQRTALGAAPDGRRADARRPVHSPTAHGIGERVAAARHGDVADASPAHVEAEPVGTARLDPLAPVLSPDDDPTAGLAHNNDSADSGAATAAELAGGSARIHARPRRLRRRRHLWSAFGLVMVAIGILIVVLTPAEQSADEVHESEKTGKFEGWTPSYFEDFGTDARVGTFGAIYGREWNGYSGFPDTSGRGLYAPDRVLSVHDSMLDFYIRTEDGQRLVAAPLPTGYDGQTYGRFSLRFKADNIPGYKIAFMLWPESDRWNDGEIDWPEGELAGRMSPASAQVGTLRDGEMSFDTAHRVYSPTDATDWHVATTEWTPGSVKWYWDGELVGETSVPALVPTLPMRWTLQAETNLENAYISDDTSGHILIDWVRAWTYSPNEPAD